MRVLLVFGWLTVVGGLVTVDGAAGLAGRGEGEAVFHGDLVGVGLHRDLYGLARMWQSNLDSLAADHDRAPDGHPPPDGERGRWLGWPGGSGAGPVEPVPGGLRDGAGDGADYGAAGEDVRDRPVQPHGHALPGQWFSGADDVAADADVAGCVDGALDLYDLARWRRQRWRAGRDGAAGAQPGQVSGVQPGGQVLIRCPPANTWTRRVSAQILMTRPVIAGPSQICCPATHRLPDGGTTRSSSTRSMSSPPVLATPTRP
jgi:hypothetical protein